MLGNLSLRSVHYCLPFVRDNSLLSFTRQQLLDAMTDAFEVDIFRSLTDPAFNTKSVTMVRPKPRVHKLPLPVRKMDPENTNVDNNWPQLVTEEVKLKCMQDYLQNTFWHKPAVCAVCSCQQFGVPIATYQLNYLVFWCDEWLQKPGGAEESGTGRLPPLPDRSSTK